MSRVEKLKGPWITQGGVRFRPGAIEEYFGPDGNVSTWESSTCAHCQSITTIPNRRKMHEVTDVCRSCMKLICLQCAGFPCRPWEKEMERQEARARMFRDIGI